MYRKRERKETIMTTTDERLERFKNKPAYKDAGQFQEQVPESVPESVPE